MFYGFSSADMCIGMDLICGIILLCLGVTMLSEKRVRNERLNFMFLMLISCIILLYSDIFRQHILKGVFPMRMYMIAEGIVYVSMLSATTFLSLYMIKELRKSAYINFELEYLLAIVSLIAVAVWIVGALQDPNWLFDLSTPLPRGRTGNVLAQLVPAVIMLFDLILAASFSGEVRSKYLRAWIIVCILPLLSVGISLMSVELSAYAVGSVSCLVLYFVIHNDAAKQQLINENELVSARSQLMVSQIQPHFIYNSLNTIYYLIDVDPEQAKDAVSTFSGYLRQNINALKDDKPVPFTEELEHVKAYVSLEMLRFGDRLNVVYDIGPDDFTVPPLTVQPLVENAIKHGVSVKEEGGTVTLSTEKSEGGGVLLKVVDDGVGFDTARSAGDSKSTHIGILNVRQRLEIMCGATLTVTSWPGEGTVCSIYFRK